MSRTDTGALGPLPANRSCRLCGAPTRFSHTAYVRAGESVAIHVCTSCGTAFRGGMRGGDRPEVPSKAAARASRRPPVDDGPPANPVLDEATAALLRQALAQTD